MKTRIALYILILITTSVTVCGQGNRIDFTPDSIRLEFPEHEAMVVFEIRNYVNQKELVKSFPEYLKSITDHIQRSLPEGFAAGEPYHVTIAISHEDEDQIVGFGEYNFKPIGEKTNMVLYQPDPETKVRVKNNRIVELRPPGWEVRITADNFSVYVYAATYEGLQAMTRENFTAVASKIDSHPRMSSIGRRTIQSRMILRQGSIASDSTHFNYPLDMLSINLVGGVGLLQNRLFPELDITVGIWRNDRFRRPRTKFEFGYQNMFFAEAIPEGGYRSHINSFVTFSFGKNFSKSTNSRPGWTGVGVGYLIRNEGDYFKGNTIKFFMFNDIGSSRLQVVPEFYLTDDFKQFNFGMKLKYVF